MKKIFYLLIAGALMLVASCQKPEYVLPTAERQGITSLTAYFTEGQYNGKELAKLTLENGEDPDRYVIPVPWFYPEESEESTIKYMSKVRVKAELAENCSISPALTILNLLEENKFTYTNARGESKPIVITGTRVKSAKTDMVSFNLLDSKNEIFLEGFVDNDERIIYLFSVEDLTGYKADAKAFVHASIKNANKLLEITDWNSEQKLTVVAQDEVTETEYKIIKRDPVKIPYGINAATFKPLFSLDPVVDLQSPPYIELILPSIAYVDGNLVVNFGNGSAPIYIDGRSGAKKGEIATGGRAVGAVTNDEAGNLILCNRLETLGTFEIYTAKSVTDTPTLFYSYESNDESMAGYPLGSKIKVCGDITTNARITVQYEGVSGAETGSFLEFTVVGGSVVDVQLHNLLASAGISWGPSPAWTDGIAPASAEAGVNGWYHASYGIDGMQWIKSDETIGQVLTTNDAENAWLLNPSCLDSKKFNNASYMAMLVCHHFPKWAGNTSLWLYDISNPSTVTGTYQETSSVVATTAIKLEDGTYKHLIKMNNPELAPGDVTCSSGDVVIASSPDGFKMFIYYYDHYAGTIGGFVADCVQK